MSRRARMRAAHDKRATALDLARFFGHGTAMPDEETEDDQAEDEALDELDAPPADQRIQIGPLDVARANHS